MIGFFDSGKGGLTTLTDCINGGLKGEIIYYADYRNAPFGNKSKAQLNDIALSCVQKLKTMNADVLVCACNTLSLACKFDEKANVITLRIPFELVDNYASCLFLGTTFSVNALPKWYFDLGGKALSLPELASLIDKTDMSENNFDKNYINEYLSEKLTIEAETVILGCTHYKFVKREIKKITNAKKILSVNDGAVQRLKSIKGDNVTVYLQKEKFEEYSSALLSLTSKPIIKVYD